MPSSLLGAILMSIAILQYGCVPLLADLNATHATNPGWPAHARFHVVTQVLTGVAVAMVALYALWSPAFAPEGGLCLATLLSAGLLGAFFISAIVRPFYGGSLSDDGGIRPAKGIDLNLLNFGISAALFTSGRLLTL